MTDGIQRIRGFTSMRYINRLFTYLLTYLHPAVHLAKLISPDDCTLQCGMWPWNRDSEFTKWQHPAI